MGPLNLKSWRVILRQGGRQEVSSWKRKQKDGGGVSLDKVEKFPFFFLLPLGRFTRSAVGLWEGPPVLGCFPTGIDSIHPSLFLLLSVRPLPPLADLSGSSSTPSLVFSVHGLLRFHSPPSFFVEPPVGGNRRGGESEACEGGETSRHQRGKSMV